MLNVIWRCYHLIHHLANGSAALYLNVKSNNCLHIKSGENHHSSLLLNGNVIIEY